jgi:hypothetical protein
MRSADAIGATCLVVGFLILAAARFHRRRAGKPQAAPAREPELIPSLVTLHSAAEGILVTGGPGAGKTSAVLAQIILGALKAGCGAIWLCVKPDEPQRALALVRAAGREQDVIMFAPGSGYCCDPLHAELTAKGGSVESAVAMIDSTIQVITRTEGNRGEESFWRGLLLKTADFTVRTVCLASGTCSLLDAYALLKDAPVSLEQLQDLSWRRSSFCAQCLLEAAARHPGNMDVELCGDWWLQEWPQMAEKTRGIAHTQLTNILKHFIHEPLRSMVAGKSNVSPDDPQRGKIIVAAMPVLEYRERGQLFGVLMKRAVQNATLRRDVRMSPVPVLCVHDEAQWFILPDVDAMVQSVARQSRFISLAAIQTLPGLIAAMGGSEKAKQEAEAWIGLHMTKILCANGCKQTNEFFSELLGHSKHLFMNGSSSFGEYDLVDDLMGQGGGRASGGFSEQWHFDVPPASFTKLRKGGPPEFVVEAFVFQGGRRYAANRNRTWVKHQFKQWLG